jgi:hypothetical protein
MATRIIISDCRRCLGGSGKTDGIMEAGSRHPADNADCRIDYIPPADIERNIRELMDVASFTPGL